MKSTTTLAIAAVLIGTGCAQAGARQTQAPKPAAGASTSRTAAKPTGAPAATTPPAGGEKKSIAALVKPTKKIDGLFTVYQDTANGQIMMAVSKDKLGK